MFTKFKKLVITELQTVERFQDNVASAIELLPSVEIIQGRLVKNVNLKTGQNNAIEHKLARTLLGWYIVRKKSAADIWDTQDSNKTPALTLNLTCNADVQVDIWVF